MNIQNLGFVALIVGVASAIYFAWTLLRQFSVSRWPSAQGKVLESRVDNSASSCAPYVKYQYSVGGRSYQSDQFRPVKYRHNIRNLTNVEKMVEPFYVGKTVAVYYDPKNPADAVLQKRDSIFGNVFWVIFAGIFISAGWGMIHSAASREKASLPQPNVNAREGAVHRSA